MSADKLPTARTAVSGLDVDVAFLDVDHCFDGWSGTAHLRDELLHVTLSASLARLVVFTNDQKDFIAVEPVSHVNNAMNQADAAALGVVILQPGESWSTTMSIDVKSVK
jgi:aldose 1-epimerase